MFHLPQIVGERRSSTLRGRPPVAIPVAAVMKSLQPAAEKPPQNN
jgi:hypothetical protein